MKFNPPIIKSFSKAPSVKSFMILVSMIIGSLSNNLSAQTAQTVSVNLSNTPVQLVDMLMNGSCSTQSNHRISSSQSVGYFRNNNSSFPISEGIIIRNGNAQFSQGSYTGQNLSSQVNTNGDTDLQAISNASGQISNITDVAFLEFDFVPNGTQFSFNFLFASNEYGEWQCGFSDVFAFLLTDLDTGITTNLAVVPGTTTPISVKDIRNNENNLSCTSVNEELFGVYNVNDPDASTINMRGQTVVMNASATVHPTHSYKIRLVIGDYNDSDYDSAVFIESGSFNTFIDIGEDVNICDTEDVTIDTQITDTVNYSFEWQRNNVTLAGETNPTLVTNQPGTYNVIVTTSNNCVLTDQMVISSLQLSQPNDIVACDNGVNTAFDLTLNDETSVGLDPAIYELLYYNSLANANANSPIPTSQLTNFISSGGQTIYIRARNRTTNDTCPSTTSFGLRAIDVVATNPTDFDICENEASINLLDRVQNQILNGLNPAEYSISYHESMDDATNNRDAIVNITNYNAPTTVTTLWARLYNNANPECHDIVDFVVDVSLTPTADTLPDVVVCDSFTLPAITNGTYYLQAGGNGPSYSAGITFTSSTRVYIYIESTEGCSSETSFKIEVLQSYVIETDHCTQFSLPTPPAGSFYTQPNGPNGTGVELPPGTVLTTSQRIYYYSEFNGLPCVDRSFDITIFDPPLVDELPDVVSCSNFTLPPLTNGRYFTGGNGTGSQLFPGDEIDSSINFVYIFNDDGTCTSESRFQVVVLDVTDFQDVNSCGSYTLPAIATNIGGYFTEPNGAGTPLPVGTVIDTDQTVYYYAETTDATNCTTNLSFDITIHPVPPVSDHYVDVVSCIDQPYVLEPVQFGNYFTEPNGQGTRLMPGDLITSTQTIYVYNTNALCSNEHSFNVEIRPLPTVDNFTDIFTCDPYTLPTLTNGSYYTEPNAQGTQLNGGDVITSTQTIYIYNQYPDLLTCVSENVFTINILGVEVDELPDVSMCESYTLPTLNVGEYFTQPNGRGTQLFPGDVITSTQTLYIYAENGNRFFCFDNHEFTVTITTTPNSQNFQNQEGCGTYTLETLNIPGVIVNYYRQADGVNLINPSEYTLTQAGLYTIHARSANQNNPNCYVDEVFSVTVHPLRELTIDDAIICVDAESGLTTQTAILESGLDPTAFTVNWYLNGNLEGTGVDFEAMEAGTYTVETIKLTPDVGDDCNYETTEVTVRASSPSAEITFLTEAFDALTNIRVDFIDTGLGTYEYQLDNGPFQTSNIFLNIPVGDHVITIRDTSNLCGNIRLPFTALGYPSFFTPNGDGINDTWNIPDLRDNTEAVIKIYDRYGRFIKEIKPSESGWNGFANNGEPSPSNSYWFKVEFIHQGQLKTFTSYFALERK